MIEDGVNTDAVLRQIFSGAAAIALDQAILSGSGSSNQPRGILNTSGLQSVSMGTDGAKLGSTGGFYDPIFLAISAIESANAGGTSRRW